MGVIKQYYRLTKPGIVYGNLLAATAGFFLASFGTIDVPLLAATLVGLGLVIASGCVFNNYIDRGIDAHMARTKRRALVEGRIPGRHALTYAGVLGLIGLTILLGLVNSLSAAIAFTGFVFYVIIYGIAKRRGAYGTIVGSVSGAIPPVVGYVAVSGRLDLGAALLFIILVVWQMPHFYAIAINRREDYAAASIPVLPVVRGIRRTRAHILIYILAFALAACMLTRYGYTGYTYLAVMGMASAAWFVVAARGFQPGGESAWARRVFKTSLIVLTVFCIILSLDAVLP